MAKSTEQKFVDAVENIASNRFRPEEFARLLSSGSTYAQYAFYDAMIGFIAYKAVYADNYGGEFGDLPHDSIVRVCQRLRDELVRYLGAVEKQSQTALPNEYI